MGKEKQTKKTKKKKKGKLKIGLLYLGLHNQLVKKYGEEAVITRKELFTKLGKHYMIPKDLRHYIIKEMVKINLMEIVNRDFVKVLRSDINIETDKNKLYNLINSLIVTKV